MDYKLTVTQAFGAFSVGDDITDEFDITAALIAHSGSVVKTALVRPEAIDPSAQPVVTFAGAQAAAKRKP